MIKFIKGRFTAFFAEGHERTILAKRNIAFSFLLKGFSILIGLLLLSITITYINPSQYGIWLTLSSIVSWISFFDIGLGNGLKNKLAHANALKQHKESITYVSTTYAVLTIIAAGLFTVFAIINHFLNWNDILNAKNSSASLGLVALIVFGSFCLQFIMQIVNTVLTACHLVSKVSLILLIGQVITLIAIYALMKFTQGSLVLLVSINGVVPVITLLGASIWYYRNDLKAYSPQFKAIDFTFSKDLLSLGGVFFIIQMGAIILFQTDNIVVTQLFGPQQVTTFNIAYKLFSVFILGFNIILTPFWSAFTDAYAINDIDWIKAMISKMTRIWVGICIGALLLYLLAPFIYKLWLNDSVKVPPSLSFAMAIYVAAYGWQTIHVNFLNGINKIRLQLYLVTVSSLLNIPIAIFLGHKIGLAGITWSNTILFIIMGAIFSVQTKKILHKKAAGIFNA